MTNEYEYKGHKVKTQGVYKLPNGKYHIEYYCSDFNLHATSVERMNQKIDFRINDF
jgi:hypothetical protein